jgi:hypothetical protein
MLWVWKAKVLGSVLFRGLLQAAQNAAMLGSGEWDPMVNPLTRLIDLSCFVEEVYGFADA